MKAPIWKEHCNGVLHAVRNALAQPSWPCVTDSVQYQCIPAFHRAVAGATVRLAADTAAMGDAFWCRPLQVVASRPSASSELRVRQPGPSDFIRCEIGTAVRLGHARGHASALSPSAPDP
jgi:hypothetical protein